MTVDEYRLDQYHCAPKILEFIAPVAQLDRALPSGGRGQRFESSRARHKIDKLRTFRFYNFPGYPISHFCINLLEE